MSDILFSLYLYPYPYPYPIPILTLSYPYPIPIPTPIPNPIPIPILSSNNRGKNIYIYFYRIYYLQFSILALYLEAGQLANSKLLEHQIWPAGQLPHHHGVKQSIEEETSSLSKWSRNL